MSSTKNPRVEQSPPDSVDSGSGGENNRETFRLVSTNFGLDLRLLSERRARLIASALAIAVAASLGLWLYRAAMLLDACRSVGTQTGCVQPIQLLRWTQFLFAIVGAVAGAVVIGYLMHFAATGRTWRARKVPALIFSILAGVWMILYGLGALFVGKLWFGAAVIAFTLLIGIGALMARRTRRSDVF